MPIYEYTCRDCGTVSEFLVGVTKDTATIKCGFCNSENSDKVFSRSFVSAGSCIMGSPVDETCRVGQKGAIRRRARVMESANDDSL